MDFFPLLRAKYFYRTALVCIGARIHRINSFSCAISIPLDSRLSRDANDGSTTIAAWHSCHNSLSFFLSFPHTTSFLIFLPPPSRKRARLQSFRDNSRSPNAHTRLFMKIGFVSLSLFLSLSLSPPIENRSITDACQPILPRLDEKTRTTEKKLDANRA